MFYLPSPNTKNQNIFVHMFITGTPIGDSFPPYITVYLLSTIIKLSLHILALVSICRIRCEPLTEEGYIYSVDERKFLDYQHKQEGLVFVEYDHMPPVFKMVETESGAVFIEAENGDVFDSSRSNYDLILFKKHGGWNQQFVLETVPRDMIKLRVGDRCMTTEKNMKYLTEVDCDTFSKKPGQFFKWISKKDENVVRDFIERCKHSGRRKRPRYDDEAYDDDEYPDGYSPRYPRRSHGQPYRKRPRVRRRGDGTRDDYDNEPRDYDRRDYDRRDYDRRDNDRRPYDRPYDAYDDSSYDGNDRRARRFDSCLGINEDDLRDKLYDLRAIANNNVSL
ncbi:putative Ricin B-related lectin protein [Trachipleistophora hominis]|uniref:Putative Ricin B-related lectin protein n=1 Tax=Trachipleistophora hominis TaxID=72359 RepID=L7JXG9_TRAHO|nr:putative Ricin B-related lectin protein [Trachipleistophora hominis]